MDIICLSAEMREEQEIRGWIFGIYRVLGDREKGYEFFWGVLELEFWEVHFGSFGALISKEKAL